MESQAGRLVAELSGLWSAVLLVGCMGPHLVVLGLTLRAWWSRPLARWLLGAELVYGFVNPVMYLLVFQPALFRSWTPEGLPALCWAAWGAYWGARLLGASLGAGPERERRWVRTLLQGVVGLVVLLTLRDAAATAAGGPEDVLQAVVCLPLYALPAVTALRQLADTRGDEAWSGSRFFLVRWPRRAALTVGLVVAGAVTATLPRRQVEDVRAELLTHRQTIFAISRERHLDPRVLAAIVEVTQRGPRRPFGARLEELVAGAWLADRNSHLMLAEALDPSLGLAQVKAHTLLTAHALLALSAPGEDGWLGKEYRSVRTREEAVLRRVPSPALLRVRTALGSPLPGKAEVLEALRTPEGNLACAAFLLDVLATQWEGANPAWSIRARPEILATLFQLGFERSWPKADPQPNDFGLEVGRAFEDPWMSAAFGPGVD